MHCLRLALLFAIAQSGALALSTPASAQSPRWHRAAIMPQLEGHAMVYDIARERVVLFGGSDPGFYVDETWEWDGRRWDRRTTSAATPPLQLTPALAYDYSRRRTVHFCEGAQRETWEWDGDQWLRRAAAAGPPARRAHHMAWDATRRRTVLWGGEWMGTQLRDTWEWDGARWIEIKPSTQAPPGGLALVFDAARQRVVLVRRLQNNTVVLWDWDGTNWSRPTMQGTPPRLRSAAATYDIARGAVLVLGQNASTGAAETWSWNGLAWAQHRGSQPPSRRRHALAYDTVRREVVLYGGLRDPFRRMHGDTWAWNGTRWTRRSAAQSPLGRTGHRMVYDPRRRRTVLFGMRNSVFKFDDTWEFDGTRWIELSPKTKPPARYAQQMAYDPRRGRILMCGGVTHTTRDLRTWEWDGNDWRVRSQASPFSEFRRAAIASDGTRIIGFGGLAMGRRSNETWAWNGTAWRLLTPSTQPPGRYQHAMAYDAARGRLVLYGGREGAKVFDDTWEWNGATWRRINTQRSAGRRADHSMTYDPQRRRIVMHADDGSIWEWDGTNWSMRAPARSPLGKPGTQLVYDEAQRRYVAFGGGWGFYWDNAATWFFGDLQPAQSLRLGTPCAASTLPRLTSSTPEFAGRLVFELADHSTHAACAFLLSTRVAAQRIGACTLYPQAPWLPLASLANSSGVARSRAFAIPADRRLRGTLLYAQGFVLDPKGPALGLRWSAGRRLMIGD